jgi:hypothetical protein
MHGDEERYAAYFARSMTESPTEKVISKAS